MMITVASFGCKKNENEIPAPKVSSTVPSDGSTRISATSEVCIFYDQVVILDNSYQITVNGTAETATASGSKVIINVALAEGTKYTVNVSARSVKNASRNYAAALTFSFTTKYPQPTNGLYEAEYAQFSSTNSVMTDISGYSGTGYVGGFHNMTDYVTFDLENITAGRYDLSIGYSTADYGSKVCNVSVNGITGSFDLTASPTFTEKKFTTVLLQAGSNTITITPNWTWFLIDYIKIVASTNSDTTFNIAPNLVTPGASAEAVNLYNYLKSSFLSSVMAGTMANYSTNIIEATWVYNNAGKWPALTCFDFIDHTIRNSGSIAYEAPFTLGQSWWSNNGIVALMWHWRDPLTKTGSFYTANTTFDVSKISDTTSAEYVAMVNDIDTIAMYLKEFRDANIPVIWRPLHEAEGAWFWWGAKGADPFKALWKLMYNRLVNYHGLNNLIWVFTTTSDSGAPDWYPGDDYVDILGMDIYPAENDHTSKYFEFERVRDMFGGKKVITLSECGSAPDPAQMKKYGDMWSWFMPWNGDYTESDIYNGVSWWKKFFSYSYVITRDKMPDLH
jgi:mannan endo-1,4-beta-mannosidase